MIIIKKFNVDTWNDFVSLMQTDSQCAECWCLNHREPVGCVTGVAAQEKMQKFAAKKKIGGLLGYQDQECIGWIAIDPITELVGHDCHSTGKRDEWSIHCLFIKDGFRGQGTSKQLIIAAIDFAESNGAKIISAFPIPEENRNLFPVNEAEFSGRFSTYLKLGFTPLEASGEFYQRMELIVPEKHTFS